jgi:formyl-CoA transferase/CoA:oxalate CoA-transferase
MTSEPPLAGLTVLDLTRVLSGPYCTMLLADMGARVIKVEQPGLGDDTRAWGPPFLGSESSYYLSVNRNKESLTLDLKSPAARPVLDRLLPRADILVENFRPGTMARFGLDYPTVSAAHGALVYCSISGFGQNGPRRDQAGYDAVVQAEGGLMSITGDPRTPPVRLGVAISDIVSGMSAFQGITLALLARTRTGRGQLVDIAMLDATAALLTYQASSYFATGVAPVRMGNRHASIVPYETFAASDGDLVLAVGNDVLWRGFCGAIGLDALGEDPRFATNRQRVLGYDLLIPLIAERLRTRSRGEWIRVLTGVGVPCGAVRDIADVMADPQLAAREMIQQVDHATLGALRVLGIPVKLSENPGAIRMAPPTLGEHTEAILTGELGFTRGEVEGMRGAGVV